MDIAVIVGGVFTSIVTVFTAINAYLNNRIRLEWEFLPTGIPAEPNVKLLNIQIKNNGGAPLKMVESTIQLPDSVSISQVNVSPSEQSINTEIRNQNSNRIRILTDCLHVNSYVIISITCSPVEEDKIHVSIRSQEGHSGRQKRPRSRRFQKTMDFILAATSILSVCFFIIFYSWFYIYTKDQALKIEQTLDRIEIGDLYLENNQFDRAIGMYKSVLFKENSILPVRKLCNAYIKSGNEKDLIDFLKIVKKHYAPYIFELILNSPELAGVNDHREIKAMLTANPDSKKEK